MEATTKRQRRALAKDALLADRSGTYFTAPHFDRSATILARLDAIGERESRELIEAWLCRAPARLAREYLAEDR